MTLTWESVQEGDQIPELIKKPGVTQLVKYAAGGGDFNPLHHDFNFFQSLRVQGPGGGIKGPPGGPLPPEVQYRGKRN